MLISSCISLEWFILHMCVGGGGSEDVSVLIWHRAFYPMTKTHNSCRKVMCRNAQFPHGCLDVSCRSRDKSKNPSLGRNCIFLNLVHHQYLESMTLQAECFPGPDDAPRWEMHDFCMGMGSCYIRWYQHMQLIGTFMEKSEGAHSFGQALFTSITVYC